jgi:hypothetical protein
MGRYQNSILTCGARSVKHSNASLPPHRVYELSLTLTRVSMTGETRDYPGSLFRSRRAGLIGYGVPKLVDSSHQLQRAHHKSLTNNGGRNDNSSSPLFWRSTCTAPDKEGGHPKHSTVIPIAIVFYNNIVSTTELNNTLRKELKCITGSSWREETPLFSPANPMTPPIQDRQSHH